MRRRIETLLEELGHFSYRHAWGVIFAVLLTIGASVTQIPRIEVRTSVDEFLIAGDETKAAYDDFLAEFGRDDMVLIALEPPEVFDLEFLTQLREFHEALEDEVPHVREVKSLINARETRGVDDGLIVGELFEDWPETPEALAAIRARALANPLYVDFILSKNADLTIVTVELEAFSAFFEDADDLTGFDDEDSNEGAAEDAGDLSRLSGAQEAEVVKALSAVVDRFNSESFRIYAGGAPILNVRMMTSLVTNILVFTGLSTCLIGFFLVLVLRRAIGVFIPLSVAILSLITTLGAMGALGIPAMPISEIVPSFLLSIGVGASVHLIAIFLQRLEAGDSREDAVAASLGHSGLPIIMTGLTTAGGLASFAAADLLPIAVFGIVSPLGIIICLLLTLTLAPALLAVIPMKMQTPPAQTPENQAPEPDGLSIRLLSRGGEFATTHPGIVLGGSGLLVVLAIVGMLRLHVSFDNLECSPTTWTQRSRRRSSTNTSADQWPLNS